MSVSSAPRLLPRVAVLGSGVVTNDAIVTLIDSGLDTTGITIDAPPPEALAPLAERGQTNRLRVVDAASHRSGPRTAESGDGGFQLRSAPGRLPPWRLTVGGTEIGCWDAVVIAEASAGLVAEQWVAGSPDAVPDHPREPGSATDQGAEPIHFGGVFHPDLEGVFYLGRVPAPGDDSDLGCDRTVGAAQARWVGDYLRGRYLLPARSVMVARPGLRRRARPPLGPSRLGSRGYLRALGRERRRGQARAAQAGYPLPVPARTG